MQKGQTTRRMALTGGAAAMIGGSAKGAAMAAETIWSGDYWASKTRNGQTIRLAMYRKRLGAPQAGEAARPVLFLVHGSSNSAKSSFDLTVPGGGEY
jgi:hypothetical protein